MVRSAEGATFQATELLGRPTDSSVTVNLLADQDLEVYIEYGTVPGTYTGQTATALFPGGEPIEITIDGLQQNTRYYYRIVYRETGTPEWIPRNEFTFHTQRVPGSTFKFSIISDSHHNTFLANAGLYGRALWNIAADTPDFHIDLGDAFIMDGINTISEAQEVYLSHRPFHGVISHSTPVFLVLGNHENEEGWNLDDSPDPAYSTPILSTNARKRFYLNPVPDGFYSGNSDNSNQDIEGDHLRENYYSWEWGDALFVVLDPFWATLTKPYAGSLGGEADDEQVGDRWDWTLGDRQYQWFQQTLVNSTARYKFVFAHQVAGGTQDYGRGGAKTAPFFEWGGCSEAYSWEWDMHRPGWDRPIHDLMVANRVTAFFHGHDHVFAMENIDGIIYQECPRPNDENYSIGFFSNLTDYENATLITNSGHISVTVSPEEVVVRYIRSYLPGDGFNGQVAYTYTIEENTDMPLQPRLMRQRSCYPRSSPRRKARNHPLH